MRALCLLLAIAGPGCFPIAPLADCVDQGGLYVAHHVCMPLAGPPLAIAGEPRRLIVGDFDDRGSMDDLAVLFAPDVVHIYTGLDRVAPTPTWEGALLGATAEVEGIAGVRYFDEGAHGDDLLAWTVDTGASADATGQLIGLRNGGDLFAGEVPARVPLAVLVDGEPNARPCPLPNSVVGLGGPGATYARTLAITCSLPTLLTLDLPDVIVLRNDPTTPLADQPQLGAVTSLADAHAAVTAQLDDSGLPRLVVAHRPPDEDHDRIAILTLAEGAPVKMIEIEPRFGYIDQLAVADLDADGDLDLVSLHTNERGISVVAQTEPLGFAEPEFFSLNALGTAIVAGDFTGDGGIDIAVAHEVDDSPRDAITLFVRSPDLAPGTIEIEPVIVGAIDGTIIDLVALDLDSDSRTDLAIAVRQGTRGSVQLFLNRSPGDTAGH